MMRPDIGLYVHIPFCRHRCHFCAFYLEIAHSDRMARFHSAFIQEIALHGQHDVLKGRRLQSIYFGGGTPTSLPPDQLVSLLSLIRTTWPTGPTTEITVEGHPSFLTAEDLTILADAGFNRISFGAESMSESDFASLGRHGQVQDIAPAVRAARSAGLVNVNLDLMYALPGQDVAGAEADVAEAIALVGVDQAPPDAVMEQIELLPQVRYAKLLRF